MRIQTVGLAALAFVAGCSFSGDFLFPGAIDGVPAVLHIEAEGGGPIIPVVVPVDDDTTPDVNEAVEAVRGATVYVELGPSGDAAVSGLTFNFEGTGGSVCVLADPELVYWNQAVGTQGGASTTRWRFPDNPYDDGDVDLNAGLSVYYTGTEGERMGNFAVQYQDSLGNTVPINLVACTIAADVTFNPTAHAGRGAPEYCTISNTQPGVSYTVALDVFSLPPDDNRLSLGLLLADGGCNPLIERAAPAIAGVLEHVNEECIIMGEAIPGGAEGFVYYGYEADRSWARSEDFEARFCSGDPMRAFCTDEFDAKSEAGLDCDYYTPENDDEKCYCGDARSTPTGGAF
ncbi:MAG: hypothetical protein H6737_20745 [Alphaproteobacteria bacterium]|nr:hypothetical protein [Alphaproteobacteria bacterium]